MARAVTQAEYEAQMADYIARRDSAMAEELCKAFGARDARAGKPIEHFYKVSITRHSERLRAAYEIGWRDEMEQIRKETNK